MDLLDLDSLRGRSQQECQQLLTAAMLRTYEESDASHSAAGRRRWLAAWRAWVDEAEVKDLNGLPPEIWLLVQTAIDLAEKMLPPTTEP